jgi:hypothetical protein
MQKPKSHDAVKLVKAASRANVGPVPVTKRIPNKKRKGVCRSTHLPCPCPSHWLEEDSNG